MKVLDASQITEDVIKAHGLTQGEYARICDILGRRPNITELGIYSAMWSEHCSYKNSRPVLKLFPTEGKNLLVKAGEENAGCVDIGDGMAIVFKIESHNHPSAVEPFQGAATGVGGIIRDIFTMGAYPIMLMNSLRFGSLDEERNKRLLRGVVAGVAHYGNCIGIPTVGGEIYFDDFYEGNPLVNVFCLGVIEKSALTKGAASGVGNSVFYVGAATGRDGLGGASFASRELTDESMEDRPAVQVGDPFMEKLLLEACLELVKSGALVGMQDMGAAGLTCSVCETASRGNAGIAVDLAKVPRREEGMVPYELMISESQERMLVIAKKGKEKIVQDILEKWDLHAEKIGEVATGSMMKIYDNGELAAEIPVKSLTDDAPLYQREMSRPKYLDEAQKLDLDEIQIPRNLSQTLLKLLDSPTIASKKWIFQQYDHMVQTNTVFLPGHDAALVRVKGTKKAIAVSTDCNGLYVYLDPFEGGRIAVCESARNVYCSGAKPLAISNCLNFGNPMKPEIFWQFRKAVEGMSAACRALETPVTGGNVSFYNESPQGAIYPTPTVSMVGLLDDIECRIPSFFQKEGDSIYLLGETKEELGGSQYLLTIHNLRKGTPPELSFEKEKALCSLMLDLSAKKILSSAHDLSDGGFAVALAECLLGTIDHPLGAKITNLNWAEGLRQDAALFGETQTRAIVSLNPKQEKKLEALAKKSGIPCVKIGTVTKKDLSVGSWIKLTSSEIESTYRNAIPRRMKS